MKKQEKEHKVGGSKQAARKFGGKNDFGIPAKEATVANDDPYGRVKGPEKGTGPTRSGAQGRRTTGVGAPTGPAGAGRGGDLDPDIIGVGGTGGVARDGPDRTQGPDITEGGSGTFASGPPAKGDNQPPKGQHGGSVRVQGTTTTGDISGSETAASTSGGQEELRDIHDEDKTINPQTGGPARANENRDTRTE
jgi:hypothetical protein